jgi:hypothetical protein
MAHQSLSCPDYDVIWSTPSRDCIDSMPLSGRHGAGANVWVQDGSIWIYLAHSGAFDEQLRLLKLGCLKITPLHAPLGASRDFRQQLHLEDGRISIAEGAFRAELWFASEVLYIQIFRGPGLNANELAFGSWRDQDRAGLSLDMGNRLHSLRADQFVADRSGLVWFHCNANHAPAVAERAQKQGIDPDALNDIITCRVFGGALAVDAPLDQWRAESVRWQGWDGTAWKTRVESRDPITIAVRLAAGTEELSSDWQQESHAALAPDRIERARDEERMRWREFWSRSHIHVSPDAGRDDSGFLVGQNYQLFRYMTACNREGEFPLLFNGGIFTVDNLPGRVRGNNNDELPIDAGGEPTPDFRRWMYCGFMSQNQRWLGWPGIAAGDADLVAPSLAFYRERAAVASARAAVNGAEGVVYPEPMDALGLCCVWPLPDGLCGATHLTHHFSMMLEHAWMAIQLHDVLGTPIRHDLDWMVGTVLFYDSYYRRQTLKRTGRELSANGQLVLYPANGLEYAVGATNPVEVVAGLHRVVEGLLRQDELAEDLRTRLTQIQAMLPPLPIGEREGKRSLLPAESYEKGYNRWEPIEHYAAWPYRMVGVTRPETVRLARDTWDTIPADRAKLCKQDYSWMANVINMAACGWAEEAKARVIWKLSNTAAPQARFPAFFGPGHDWLPDHNWGGAGMTGLQEMLLAPEPGPTGKLYLLPAWPDEWDVAFKLHAPGQTTVEAEVRGGRLVRVVVSPPDRASDLVIPDRFRA